MFPVMISGEDYLTIARLYAEAYETQIAVADYYLEAADQLRCVDDVGVTVDLLPTFYTIAMIGKAWAEDMRSYLAPVAALQRHVVLRSGLDVADWIDVAVHGGVVPYWWAVMSKKVGFDIDSVIDPDTIPSGL